MQRRRMSRVGRGAGGNDSRGSIERIAVHMVGRQSETSKRRRGLALRPCRLELGAWYEDAEGGRPGCASDGKQLRRALVGRVEEPETYTAAQNKQRPEDGESP